MFESSLSVKNTEKKCTFFEHAFIIMYSIIHIYSMYITPINYDNTPTR